MSVYKKILVALDGSSVAEAILSFIVPIARPLGFELLLLNVVRSITPAESERSRAFVRDEQAEFVAEARRYLDPLVTDLTEHEVNARALVREGLPAEQIIAAARAEAADVIAMTTHGRSGLRLLVMGSVANAVVHQTEIPVLLMTVTERQVAAGRSLWRTRG